MVSDVGLVRPVNEDSLVYEVLDPARPIVLAAVADGVGGNVAGEVASRMATTELKVEVADRGRAVLATEDAGARESVAKSLLALGFERAQTAIRREAQLKPELTGMASTLTAALLVGRDLFIAHVGDSRAYHWSGGTLTQVSEDHSLVAFMVKNGSLTLDEARVHPHRHVLTQALGTDQSPVVELALVRVAPGDLVLLCTDGLSAVVDDGELGSVLASAAADSDRINNLAQAVERLVSMAKERGGPDNITLILMEMDQVHAVAGEGASHDR